MLSEVVLDVKAKVVGVSLGVQTRAVEVLVSANLPVGVNLVIEVDVSIPELASLSVVGEVCSF